MPPVQDIALDELVAGVEQDLRPREAWSMMDERGRVLKLIAIAVRAAGLIEGGPGPYPARQVLVRQPPVEHHVDGRDRGLHGDRRKERAPVALHLLQGARHRSGLAVARHWVSQRLVARALPEEKGELGALPGRQRHS